MCGLSEVEKGEKLNYCWPVKENIKRESETVKYVSVFLFYYRLIVVNLNVPYYGKSKGRPFIVAHKTPIWQVFTGYNEKCYCAPTLLYYCMLELTMFDMKRPPYSWYVPVTQCHSSRWRRWGNECPGPCRQLSGCTAVTVDLCLILIDVAGRALFRLKETGLRSP